MGSGRRTKRQLSCGGAPLPLSYQGILLRQLKRKPLRGSLSPFGAFFPGFTVTAGLVGLIYGLFLHQKGEGFHGRALWLRVVGASLCASLTRLVLNSVWLYIMYGKGLFGMLPARFTETICMVAAQILLIPVLLSLSRQLTRRGAFPA